MIIDAESMQNPSKAAQFAERMLEIMQHESSSNHRVEPDLVTYNSVINAWSKSGLRDAGEKSQVLLQRMEELGLKPDTISFNAAISAWANSNDSSAGQRAELLLQKMSKLGEAGHVDAKPNTTSFNSAIAAWTNSRSAFAANKAEAILRRMIE
jgi:pentatricopeptide repeat protein